MFKMTTLSQEEALTRIRTLNPNNEFKSLMFYGIGCMTAMRLKNDGLIISNAHLKMPKDTTPLAWKLKL